MDILDAFSDYSYDKENTFEEVKMQCAFCMGCWQQIQQRVTDLLWREDQLH